MTTLRRMYDGDIIIFVQVCTCVNVTCQCVWHMSFAWFLPVCFLW